VVMVTSSLVGVVGDFNASNPTHRFTNDALTTAGMDFEWVPTESLGSDPPERLGHFDGLWIAPARRGRPRSAGTRSSPVIPRLLPGTGRRGVC
jgi:hypothetical protein